VGCLVAGLESKKNSKYNHGTDSPLSPNVSEISDRIEQMWDFTNRRSAVNIPELNERFRRMGKSTDIAEISKLVVEIYRYAYDQYLNIPICEFPDQIATTKRIPNGI